MPIVSTMANIAIRPLGFGSLSSSYWHIDVVDSNLNSQAGNNIIQLANGNIAYTLSDAAYDPITTYDAGIIVVVNKSGELQWSRSIYHTGSVNTLSLSIASDSSSNIYAHVYDQQTDDVDLVKFDSSGTYQWARRISFSDTLQSNGIACNSDGSYVYLNVGINATSTDIGVVKFNTGTLAIAWDERASTANNYQTAYGYIALDSSENVYQLMVDLSEDNACVTKWNSSGTFQWGKAYVTNTASLGAVIYGIDTDSSGNVYFGFGDTTYDTIHVVKVNSSNVVQWSRSLTKSGIGISSSGSFVVDSNNNVYLLMGYGDAAGKSFSLIAKYDSSGVLQFQRKLSADLGGVDSLPSFDGLNVTSDGMYISGANALYHNLIFLPSDGSGTGTWSQPSDGSLIYTYENDSMTDSSFTLTTGTNPAGTTWAPTLNATGLPSTATVTPTINKAGL